jgi:hypothetical protein
MLVLALLLACHKGDDTPEDMECTALCTSLDTVPADGDVVRPTSTVSVALEPDDRAFEATLFDPDGAEVGAVIGVGSGDLLLSVNTLAAGDYELFVRSSCAAAPAEICNEDTVRFSIAADATTPSTVGHDIVQVQKLRAIDVLMVLDDSCSMSTRQLDLQDGVLRFMAHISGSGLDYHVGVVTTSPGSAALNTYQGHAWVDENTPNPTTVLSSLGRVGTQGDSYAQGLTTSLAAVDAAQPGGVNEGFVGDNAELLVLVVSDSDDKGDIATDVYIDWLNGLGRPSAVLVPYVLATGFDKGTRYLTVADATSGLSFDLDEMFSSDSLSQLGLQGSGRVRSFCTSEEADVDTLRVEVVNEGVTRSFDRSEWEVGYGEPTCIEFLGGYLPEPGSAVHFYYEPAR